MLAAAVWACASASAAMPEPDKPTPSRPALQKSDDTDRARAEFLAGTKLVEQSQWAEALAAFERAEAFRPHAVTTFNIGGCERAMGRYARAKTTFERALAQNDAERGVQLSESLVEETRGYIREIEALLAHLEITLVPSNAAIAVDGRPLSLIGKNDPPLLIAGVRPPGPGEAVPGSKLTVLLDPGVHVFVISRKGFSDAVLQETLTPGSTRSVRWELDRLPATLHIAANRQGALVEVDGKDVGPAPVDLTRPAGRYRVTVRRDGFERFESVVIAQPGELVELLATLKPRTPSIVERWWFWTLAGVAVTGVAVGTYFATRPEPTRPAIDGGTLGWKVEL